MLNTNPICTLCNEREGLVYLQSALVCRHCATKWHKARCFFTNPPSNAPVKRDWKERFTTVDGKRQWAMHGPTHVQTHQTLSGTVSNAND